MLRPLAIALALLAVAAPTAAARDSRLPDAEIFATSNTDLITDPDDPRLDDGLNRFGDAVTRIIDDGGGGPRGSELLDGVFASGEGLTFERSRRFDVDRVSDDELHDIAETIRRRFLQQSVLTFDHLHQSDPDIDAIELEVPGVSAKALRSGLLSDREARERLFGGSVTLDRRLLLVAGLADADFARRFAKKIGGDMHRAETHYGEREFVEVATAGRARIDKRTLHITGTPDDDTIALRNGYRLQVDFGDDGTVDYEVDRRRFSRIRVDAGEGYDSVIVDGSVYADDLHIEAKGGYAVVDRTTVDNTERVDLDAGKGADRVTVEDLSSTDVLETHAPLGAADGRVDRVTVNNSDERSQFTSIGSYLDKVHVLGDTNVDIEQTERTDRLRINGGAHSDEISASTDAMQLTLVGGGDVDGLSGGPGADLLIGGEDGDALEGGKGDDIIHGGPDSDYLWYTPGDGNDVFNGEGGTRDAVFFPGTDDAETFDIEPDGERTRLTRSGGDVVLDLDVEAIDAVAFGGADLFRIGDMRATDLNEVKANLMPMTGLPQGDKTADRVEIVGTEGDDAVTIVGKKLLSGDLTVTGLPVKLGISHAEAALDTLAIDTLGGDDTVDTSGLGPDVIGLDID